MRDRFLILMTVFAVVSRSAVAEESSVSPADLEFFEAKVRPLLIAKCYECHGEDKQKSGLRMDQRDAILTGGDSGPAAVPGKPAESLLMEVIGYRGGIQMPPKSKLPTAEIEILTEWVRKGLPWPNAKVATPTPTREVTGDVPFTDEQKAFWAFQPVGRPVRPEVKNRAWPQSPIDEFVQAELETNSLSAARPASARTLIRRLALDLTGLLPTPDEVNEFAADNAPDATERLVDRLLTSPRYGERWGRHWLDVARYADSNGLDENLAYANAFRYRDYVVRAIRQDTTYDQFLMEQIAGDLLPAPGANSSGDEQQQYFDRLTATGFLCLGAKMLAEDDPVKMQMDIIDEQVDTIARAVMGLTMGCARCHDHKFDPLTAADYYGLAGVFKSTQTMDTFSVVARWHERPLASPEQTKLLEELQQQVASKRQAIDHQKNDATTVLLDTARRHGGQYLLAAARSAQEAKLLAQAKPQGNDSDLKDRPDAILIEAEDYARGNVLKDRDNYGNGIGVLVNRGETPNFTEYDVNVAQTGVYQVELRYAAAAARPVALSIDGRLIKSDAANKATGSWTPDSQTWFVEAHVPITAGTHTIRLEQPAAFPHIDKLLLTIEATLTADGVKDRAQQSGSAKAELWPSLVAQTVKAIEVSQQDANSILTAWHQFAAQGKLQPQPEHPDNGVERLLGAAQPTSLVELAARYDRLFTEAVEADSLQKQAGKESTALNDVVLESARAYSKANPGALAPPADIEQAFPATVKADLAAAREQLAQIEKTIPQYPETMAVADTTPVNLKIHLRGNYLTLGKEISRRLPLILTGGQLQPLAEGSGRLELARWLTDPRHPLTARVMANRIWQWHFGLGLVRSPDNFGRLGERPTNPALLDWVASEFAGPLPENQQGHVLPNPRAWSMKSLHRRIVESATYQQSTEYRAEVALADPENRLFSRFQRQRMDVEVLRDSLLAVSGTLDESMGGSMLPTKNRAYVTSTANVNPEIYNSNRRSIYLPVVRSALYDVFTAFDFADPSTLNGQRDQTTVAPQALFMMNSQFVLEQSRTLAAALMAMPQDRANRIKQLYERAYNRLPKEAEVARSALYLERMQESLIRAEPDAADVEVRVWTSLCRAVLSANEFIYID